jgi:hypothetical protein
VKVGNVVRWSGKSEEPRLGLVLSYCSFQDLWYVRFPDGGDYEIEEWCLEVISECG